MSDTYGIDIDDGNVAFIDGLLPEDVPGFGAGKEIFFTEQELDALDNEGWEDYDCNCYECISHKELNTIIREFIDGIYLNNTFESKDGKEPSVAVGLMFSDIYEREVLDYLERIYPDSILYKKLKGA